MSITQGLGEKIVMQMAQRIVKTEEIQIAGRCHRYSEIK